MLIHDLTINFRKNFRFIAKTANGLSGIFSMRRIRPTRYRTC